MQQRVTGVCLALPGDEVGLLEIGRIGAAVKNGPDRRQRKPGIVKRPGQMDIGQQAKRIFA